MIAHKCGQIISQSLYTVLTLRWGLRILPSAGLSARKETILRKVRANLRDAQRHSHHKTTKKTFINMNKYYCE